MNNLLHVEECELLGDSKYRSYVSQVEKALRAFDNTTEWADLISALAKLNKVLSSHVKYPVIPKRMVIGKRLAQCLHPALPGGVHLKALETYDIIFKCIGTTRLANDLFTYSAGLFPLLGYAPMNVRPALLTIYEMHFVPLGRHVKPALTGLLLGLLPGLEENSEHFDRTNRLLEEFCLAAEKDFFYSCMWECVVTSPSIRQAAIQYVLRHFNKKQIMEDQLHFIGTNIDLLVEALCLSIEDSSVLVQRGALDLLLLGFPLHQSQLTKPDVIKVLTSVVKVVLRRDMSLNRRLYAMLLGTDSNGVPLYKRTDSLSIDRQDSDTQTVSYFHAHSRAPLVSAVKNCINEQSVNLRDSSCLYPFRILISLLDRPDIGAVILEDVLLDILRYMYSACEQASFVKSSPVFERHQVKDRKSKPKTLDRNSATEIVKTANLLFGTFEPYYIWEFLGRLFESVSGGDTCGADLSVTELCLLMDFLLDKISLESYVEIQTEHLPNLMRQVTTSMIQHLDTFSDADLMLCFKLCSKILSRVEPSMCPISDLPSPTASAPPTPAKRPISKPLSEAQKKAMEDVLEGRSLTNGEVDCETDEGVDLRDHILSEGRKNGVLDLEGACEDETSDYLDEEKSSSIDSPRTLNNISDDTENEFLEGSRTSDTDSSPDIRRPRALSASAVTIMQACLQSFRRLFGAFVTSRLLRDRNLALQLAQKLVIQESESSEKLRVAKIINDEDEVDVYSQDGVTEQTCDAFQFSCRLLMDFSAFPLFCNDSQKVLKQSFKKDITLNPLPEWFQLLLTCSCYIRHFRIHSSAVSTVLDLISLTQSVDFQPQDKVAGKIAVVIVPPLSVQQLQYLENDTRFYHVVGEKIWSHLSMQYPERHQQSVELFYQLHQLTPQPFLCEDIIGARLTHPDKLQKIKAFQRFTVLWHLLKGVKQSPPPDQQLRTFDRSVLVVLESLQNDSHPCRSIAQTWLTQALHRGEIFRLLQPLMLILLHPDTARVSIQHVHVDTSRRVRLDSGDQVAKEEAQVYAISSQGGHVIYHVNNPKPISKQSPGAIDASITTMTSLTQQDGTAMTQKASAMTPRGERDVDAEKVNPNDVKITTNPFESQNSIEHVVADYVTISPDGQVGETVQKAKRLDTETCQKEGLFFDEDHYDGESEISGNDVDDDSSDDEEEGLLSGVSSEDIVKGILDDIINNAVGLSKEGQTLRVRLSSLQSRENLSLSLDLLNSLDNKPSPTDTQSDFNGDVFKTSPEDMIHPLHTHILLYTRKYDTGRTEHALSCLKAMLMTSSRLMTCYLSTTSLGAAYSTHVGRILMLLVRHRKAVFGKNFYGEVVGDNFGALKSSMLIETVILVCLYYMRSYYPNLLMSSMGDNELHGNKQVQMLACEVLTLLLSELVDVTRDSGRGFATYISDVISRCKLQKTILHCLLASVYDAREKAKSNTENGPITEAIISFNHQQAAMLVNNNMQIRLLALVRIIIILEEQARKSRNDPESALPPEWDARGLNFQPVLGTVKYLPSRPLVHQPMFLSAVMAALRQQQQCGMHEHIVSTVTCVLPCLGRALCHTLVCVVLQLCKNLDVLAAFYSGKPHSDQPARMPPDHIVSVLEGLTSLCHYCLLEQQQDIWVAQHMPSTRAPPQPEASGNILSGLMNMFTPYASNRETSPDKEVTNAVSPILEARRHLLSNLPRILASLATLWQATERSEETRFRTYWTLGQPKALRQHMVEFVSPVSKHHGVNFLAAVAVVWNDRRQHGVPKQLSVIDGVCDSQMLMVDFVSAVKVLPMDTLIQTVTMVIKQPPPTTHSAKKRVSLQVSMLQFFLCFTQRQSARTLAEAWPALYTLIREANALGTLLPPPGHFLLLVLIHEFVQKVPMFETKKDQKEMQDLCQKLLETVTEIAGSQLEQKSLLSRNLVVRPGSQTDILTADNDMEVMEADQEAESQRRESKAKLSASGGGDSTRHFSVHALVLLGELTATLLDVTYRSEEKERAVPFLINLMSKVFPYLRNHSVENLPSLRGCSQIVASLSGYQYTRRAWKREALELLFEPDFFRMDLICIRHWNTIVDNLMTHDRTTFKDLLTRVSVTPSTALNLFTSKEQEWEQRAQLMKRLSFTVYCSEMDQYVRAMPDIQERLADSLRVMASATVQAQVFFSFRVLVLRMSPHNLTSLWPTIISELILVLQQIEHELTPPSDDNSRSFFQRIDSFLSSNGRQKQGYAGLKMYLAAFKLLEMALLLPTHMLPQFQMYKWAFVGDVIEEEASRRRPDQSRTFLPHIVKINQLMNHKFGALEASVEEAHYNHTDACPQPILTMPYITSLQELHPFFSIMSHTLTQSAMGHTHPHSRNNLHANKRPVKSQSLPSGLAEKGRARLDRQKSVDRQKDGEQNKTMLDVMENLVQNDFLEVMPRK